MGGGFHGGFITNFYVGKNGNALPGEHKKWIGVSKRDSLLKKAQNSKLRNAINQMYREGSFIGDGGTATILKFEKRTGINVGRNGNSHIQKALEMERYLKNRVLRENLSKSDMKMANKVLRKLRLAILEAKGE